MSELKKQVISGVKWSAFAKLATQMFSWLSTFFVIRILTPDDYGLIAIASVFITFVTLFTTNGLISALVRQQSKDQRNSNLIFTFSVLANLFFSILLFLLAQSISDWYSSPQLTYVLWTMAAINIITSFDVVPTAHLQIDMKFKEKALVESAAGVAGAAVALISASVGYGYWALIHSMFAITLIKTIGVNIVSRSHYRLTWDWRGSRDMLSFALYMQGGSLIWFAYNRADMIIMGRTLGVEKAGVYNVGSEVASIPMSRINAVMGEVAFSAFAKSKDDLQRAKQYLEKSLRLMGALIFPVFYGISIVANEMVYLLLGEKWSLAGPVIFILCLVLPFRMLVSIMFNFSNGMGEARFNMVNSIIMAVVLITAIYVGAMQGINETAAAWVVGFLLVYAILLFRFMKKFRLALSTLLTCWPAFLISVFMWGVVFFLDTYGFYSWNLGFSEFWSVFIVFVAKVVTGMLSAGPFLIWIYSKEFKSLLSRG
jgi:teichuronic acid exporter